MQIVAQKKIDETLRSAVFSQVLADHVVQGIDINVGRHVLLPVWRGSIDFGQQGDCHSVDPKSFALFEYFGQGLGQYLLAVCIVYKRNFVAENVFG
jgi:hypothetical protein